MPDAERTAKQDYMRAYMREYNKRPEVKARHAAYQATPRARQLRLERGRRCSVKPEQKRKQKARRGTLKGKLVDLVAAAKYRAKEAGLPFDLRPSDLDVPPFCPVLGIELIAWSRGRPSPSSVSLDRKDSSKGYTKDNVRIISWRANMLKNNMTLEEARALLADAETLREEST